MKMILIILSVLSVGLVSVSAYFGMFKNIRFFSKIEGGELVVIKKRKGDYKQSATVIDEIYQALKEINVASNKGYGRFLDNPDKVATENLRSEIGCIISLDDSKKAKQLADLYEVKQCPKQEYLTTDFPYLNQLSIVFSVFKIYPALNQYIRKNELGESKAVTEIYDITKNEIHYRVEF